MLYLDSSAIVKLVRVEAETAALEAYLVDEDALITSAVALVELRRAVRRFDWAEPPPVDCLVARLIFIELFPQILEAAASLEPTSLRTLVAIHVATALSLRGDLEALVTYDRRMVEAATFHGIPVVAPGVSA